MPHTRGKVKAENSHTLHDTSPSPVALSIERPTETSTSHGVWYLIIFVFALTVRGAYLLELRDSPLLAVLVVDARQYDDWAQEITAGNWVGDEVFYQAPFYPYFLAVIYKLFGHDTWMVRLVQIVIGSSSCVLVAIAGGYLFSPVVGAVTGFLLALYAPAVFFDVLVQKAVLGLFFTCALLALIGRLVQGQRWWWLMLCGAVLGCFALTRENALILVPIVFAWLLVYFNTLSWAQRLRSCGLVAFGLATVLVPVGVRNLVVGGEFLITTSQFGPNFFIGNNIDADGRTAPMRPRRDDPRFERQDSVEIAESQLGRELTPAEVSRYWLDLSVDYIRSNPGHWLRLLGRKWLLLTNKTEIMDAEAIEAYQLSSNLLRGLGSSAHFGVLLPLAILGLWATRARAAHLWVLYAAGLAVAVSVTLFFVNARYRMPLVPILALFASAGLQAIARPWDMPKLRSLSVGLFLAAAAGALSNAVKSPQADPVAITYANLGSAFAAQERPEEALRFYRKAIERIPALEAAHYGAGRVAGDQGLFDEAEAHFKKAIELRPDYAAAHKELGIVLRGQGKLDEAMRHYEAAIELYPRYYDAHNNLGNVYFQLGDLKTAVRCYETACGIDPEQFESRYNLGVVMIASGRLEDARRHLGNALRIDSESADAHFQMGRVLAGLGDRDGALVHVEKATLLDPTHREARSALAQLRRAP